MENENGLDNVNKYIQGSVWHWVSSADRRAGVQSGERPVLIISNNKFNQHSPSVNCVSITSVLKESPVHVPLFILKDSHIQCEQIHTIAKFELKDFKGIVPKATLSSVKAKLRLQFNMSADRTEELFQSLGKSMDKLSQNSGQAAYERVLAELEAINQKADKGFGLQETEDEFVRLLLELHTYVERISKDVELLKAAPIQAAPVPKENSLVKNILKENPPKEAEAAAEVFVPEVVVQVKTRRGGYSEEDKAFITNYDNSIDDIIEKFGITRQQAYQKRTYYSKSLSAKSVSGESAKGSHRKYSDSDKEFIMDRSNSIEDLMERFGYKDRQAAYHARAYIERTANAN